MGVEFSSSEVYSSEDDASEFSGVEMVGDDCCPWGVAWSFVTVQLDES